MPDRRGRSSGRRVSGKVKFQLSAETYIVNEIVAFRVEAIPGGKTQDKYLVLWKDYPPEEATWEPKEGLESLEGPLRERMIQLKKDFLIVQSRVQACERRLARARMLCETATSRLVSALVKARALTSSAAKESDESTSLKETSCWNPLSGDEKQVSVAIRASLVKAAGLFNASLRILDSSLWQLGEEQSLLASPYRRTSLFRRARSSDAIEGEPRDGQSAADSESERIRVLAKEAADCAEMREKRSASDAASSEPTDPLVKPPPSAMRVLHCNWKAFPKITRIESDLTGSRRVHGLYLSVQFATVDFTAERLAAAVPSESQRILLLRFAKLQCARYLVLRAPLISCAELVETLGLKSRGRVGSATVFQGLRRRLRAANFLLEAVDQSTGVYFVALRATQPQLEDLCASQEMLLKRVKSEVSFKKGVKNDEAEEFAVSNKEEKRVASDEEDCVLLDAEKASGRSDAFSLYVRRNSLASPDPLSRHSDPEELAGRTDDESGREDNAKKKRRREDPDEAGDEDLRVTGFSVAGDSSELFISVRNFHIRPEEAKWVFPHQIIRFARHAPRVFRVHSPKQDA